MGGGKWQVPNKSQRGGSRGSATILCRACSLEVVGVTPCAVSAKYICEDKIIRRLLVCRHATIDMEPI